MIGARLPKQYEIDTIEKCLKVANEFENYEEGFVIYINGIPSVKVKSMKYLAGHRIKGEGLSIGRICNLVADNEIDEYLTYFPEDTDRIMPYFNGLQIFCSQIENDFAKVCHITDHIEFAAAVKDNKYQALLFTMLKHGTDGRGAFDRLLNPSKKRILKEHMVDS